MAEKKSNPISELIKIIHQLLNLILVLIFLLITFSMYFFYGASISELLKTNKSPDSKTPKGIEENTKKNESHFWIAPEIDSIANDKQKEQLLYGKDLIAHTAKYFGPKGKLKPISNGMNCQNCHLDAGTKVFGNNYSAVASTYPKFRARSNSIEDIYKRVNDCFERSLNGKSLDSLSEEMQAIKAYIVFLGSNVKKGKKAEGAGFKELSFLDRACNPKNGSEIYKSKCLSCHQAAGEGTIQSDGIEYIYPPLWGSNSYNDGAGLYRMTNFARYVKYNMPLGASHENTQLTDEEAWDVAAFVNTQPRPHKNTSKDWPDISKKPIDHPFGPYTDSFSEKQHKYGPFKPILEDKKKMEALSKQKATAYIKL